MRIPVEKNQEIELFINDLSHEGLGVGRYEGYTIFVAGALPGELIRARLVKIKKSYGYGRMLEIIEPSAARLSPPCPIYSRCGGCQLQHLAYADQLAWKRDLVAANLLRLGGIDVAVEPVIGMAEPWAYRNKFQVPVAQSDGGPDAGLDAGLDAGSHAGLNAGHGAGLIAGFYAQRTHDVIDMEECLIQDKLGNEIFQTAKSIAREIGVRGYDETTGQGVLRHMVVRTAAATGESMLIIVTNERAFAGRDKLVERLKDELPELTSLVQNVNKRRDNVILGDEFVVLAGADVIYDELVSGAGGGAGAVRFAISPRSFYQVNPVQTQVLYEKAVEFAGLSGEEVVIDAYCGVGTIALFAAAQARQVFGVEIVEEAILDARANAVLNGIDNVEFVVGAAADVMGEWGAAGIAADVVIVDPPRKGCESELLDAIVAMAPERVVYVSCNPATLARDLRIFVDGGYEVSKVQPVDMFPQTVHVETVVLMSKVQN